MVTESDDTREDVMKKKHTKTSSQRTKEAGLETNISASEVANMPQPNCRSERAVREKNFGLGAIWNHLVEAGKRTADASKAGQAKKYRSAIYDAILDFLKTSRSARNQEVWMSFPDERAYAETGNDLRYDIFSDKDELCQIDTSRKTEKLLCIGRETFDKYVTLARRKLGTSKAGKNTQRKKKRQPTRH
jgi:hypothetical protein